MSDGPLIARMTERHVLGSVEGDRPEPGGAPTLHGGKGGAALTARLTIVWTIVRKTWLLAFVALLWFILSRASQSLYFPPMTDVLAVLRSDFLSSSARENVYPTLLAVANGFTLAVLGGLTLGYLLGSIVSARVAFAPVLDLFRATPIIALVPLFISLFGIGSKAEVLLIAWASIWPVLLSTADGVAAEDRGLSDSAKSMRMNKWQMLRLVRLRAALPRIVPGINTGLTLALVVAVAIEMYSASHGLGRYLTSAQRFFDMPRAYAGALAAGLLGYAIMSTFHLVEHRWILRWHYQMGKRESG